jgi:formylglycine-generating enzyme required for sulfatase activity
VAFIEIQETRTFEFTVATLQRQLDEWITVRQPSQAEGLVEVIAEGVELELMEIPPGTFWMGSPESEIDSSDDERPQHRVTVPGFYMGRYQVTQAQWKAMAERTDLKVNVNIDLDPDPSSFKEDPPQPPLKRGEKAKTRWDRPVENINWYEAKEFCDRLSTLTSQPYRLPTEAEWEYACRAVRQDTSAELTQEQWNQEYNQPFHFGATLSTELANYDGNYTYGGGMKGEYRQETTPVGYFQVANAFGLYDMHGNVWEWCEDDYHGDYENAPRDDRAWLDDDSNTRKVVRGGCWINLPAYCRSAYRDLDFPRNSHSSDIGFRVVRSSSRTL